MSAATRRWLRRAPDATAPTLALAWLLLGAWALGILVAAAQLDGWRRDLSRTLLQLNADAGFRARAPSRAAVDPEWYRRKALALLAATERLQHDAAWTALLPGSWRPFDDLEARVQARLAREFNDIVVETLRRELVARASRLTGVPLAGDSGELRPAADCRSPVPPDLERRLSAAAEDLPEFVAVAGYVGQVAQLDAAVRSFLSLQYGGAGQPEQLRGLVAYTLGKRLPGALEGAVRMFQDNEEVSVQPALLQARLQWAARCALRKGMAALHTRLLNTNDLFALEQGYVEASRRLFDPGARPAGLGRTLERYRTAHSLLADENALLSQGHNDWMGQGTLQLDAAYQGLLRQIVSTSLLGPDALRQLQEQSGAAFAEFRRQFEAAFGSQGEPGVVWLEGERRFGLSPERRALLAGLDALLQTSFMAEDEAPAPAKAAPHAGSLGDVLEDARALSAERARALATSVPLFPAHAQTAVMQVIDMRVSALVYQRAYRALRSTLAAGANDPADLTGVRRLRQQVQALQTLLQEAGGGAWGDRLAATLDAELLRRLARLRPDWRQLPLEDPRAVDFGWWQGEALPLAQVLGATPSGPGAQASFAGTAARLDLLLRQADPVLALGSPALALDPAAVRWLTLQAELRRYAAHANDSSLLGLERYVAALGPDLRSENCAARLAAHAPAALGDDPIARRQRTLHEALTQRCLELQDPAALAP
jgi:type VI secretion system protein ImpL